MRSSKTMALASLRRRWYSRKIGAIALRSQLGLDSRTSGPSISSVTRDEVGHPAGEDRRLAAPGPRDDEQGAVMVRGSLPLGRVEIAEQVVVVRGEGKLFHIPIIHGDAPAGPDLADDSRLSRAGAR